MEILETFMLGFLSIFYSSSLVSDFCDENSEISRNEWLFKRFCYEELTPESFGSGFLEISKLLCSLFFKFVFLISFLVFFFFNFFSSFFLFDEFESSELLQLIDFCF